MYHLLLLDPPALRAKIDAMWLGRALDDEDYDCRLDVVGSLSACRPGEGQSMMVRVTNRGGAVWPWGFERNPSIPRWHPGS